MAMEAVTMSKFSVAKKKFFKLVGSNDSVVDPEVEDLVKRHDELVQLVQKTRAQVLAWFEGVKTYLFHAGQVDSFYIDFYGKVPNGSPHPRYMLAECTKGMHDQLKDKLETAEKRLVDGPLNELKQFESALLVVKDDMKHRAVLRTQYDHYTKKINALWQKRDDALKKGKSETSSEQSKRERNEQKFENAKKSYEAKHDVCVRKLKYFYERRFTRLDPIYVQLVEMEKVLLGTIHTSLCSIVPRQLTAEQVQHVEVSSSALPTSLPPAALALKEDEGPLNAASSPKTPGRYIPQGPEGPPPAHLVRPPQPQPKKGPMPPKSPPPAHILASAAQYYSGLQALQYAAAGQTVEVLYPQDGQWHEAIIDEVLGNNKYKISYTHYDEQEDVAIERIRIRRADVAADDQKDDYTDQQWTGTADASTEDWDNQTYDYTSADAVATDQYAAPDL